MALDLKQMERDILEAALTKGAIGQVLRSNKPASIILREKYGSTEAREQLIVVTQYMLEERYLFPLMDDDNPVDSSNYVRGLTPKGLKRLRELKAPRWTWVKENWFPVAVATITAFIGLGSIGVDLYFN